MKLNGILLAATAGLLLSSVAAHAFDLPKFKTRIGTKGLKPVHLSVKNAATKPISCQTQVAHWYAEPPIDVAPGRSATIALWFDPATGIYSVLNSKRENMAVETIWCGLAGRAYATHSRIAFDIDHTPRPERTVVCRMGARNLLCR